jgi:hypothetical protein
MSSRLHNKFHRHNHHTTSINNPLYPDASYDPIASYDVPFQGPFVVQNQSVSATNTPSTDTVAIDAAGDIITNNGNIVINGIGQFTGNGAGLYNITSTSILVLSGSPFQYSAGGTNPASTAIPSLSGLGNSTSSNFTTIAGGSANVIGGSSPFSFIAGGSANNVSSSGGNTFVLGSNINATLKDTTYVNNLNTSGTVTASAFSGSGNALDLTTSSLSSTTTSLVNTVSTNLNSKITGLQSLSSNWQSVYSLVNTTTATTFNVNTLSAASTLIGRGSWVNSTYTGVSGDGVLIDYLQGNPGLGRISVGNGIGADSLAFYSNGYDYSPTTPTLYLSANGNVGINTAKPNRQLTVVGDISATGNLYGGISIPGLDLTVNSLTVTNNINAANYPTYNRLTSRQTINSNTQSIIDTINLLPNHTYVINFNLNTANQIASTTNTLSLSSSVNNFTCTSYDYMLIEAITAPPTVSTPTSPVEGITLTQYTNAWTTMPLITYTTGSLTDYTHKITVTIQTGASPATIKLYVPSITTNSNFFIGANSWYRVEMIA